MATKKSKKAPKRVSASATPRPKAKPKPAKGRSAGRAGSAKAAKTPAKRGKTPAARAAKPLPKGGRRSPAKAGKALPKRGKAPSAKAAKAASARTKGAKASAAKAGRALPLRSKTTSAKTSATARKAGSARSDKPVATAGSTRARTFRRRDALGHLDPQYAAELLEQSGPREENDRGFLEHARSRDDLAESLGETFVQSATSGEPDADAMEAEVPEERGGPFVETTGGTEFAEGTDESNPEEASREPFPTT